MGTAVSFGFSRRRHRRRRGGTDNERQGLLSGKGKLIFTAEIGRLAVMHGFVRWRPDLPRAAVNGLELVLSVISRRSSCANAAKICS